MLRVYDKDHKAAGYIKAYKDMKIESVASTGDKTLSFTYMGKKNIETEYYIQTQKDEYVVKERTQSMDGFPQYVAVLNLEELEGKPWGSFSVKEATVDEAARLALAGTGWTIGECDVKKKRNAGMLTVTSRDIIEKLAVAFLCEIVYDTKNKTVSFFNEVGEDKGAYFIRGLNLKKLSKKSDSYDYYTQIIPIGANNLTIEKVNDGKNYLENYQYSTKKRAYIWKEESYTDAQALKEDAELKLQDLSKPAESYSVTVADLARQKKQYSILEYHVGDKIWLIDSTTRTRVKQRIVKMTEYPQSPEKNTCEIANTVLTFEELQQKYKEAAEIVNTVVSGDGRYTGTVNVSDILNFEQGLSDSDIVSGINKNLDSLNKSYKEISLTVGSLDTNYLKVEDAKVKYAEIDFSNIDKAAMEYFYAHSGLIKNVSIGDAAISGELIGVTIKGDLIEGNTVKADKLVIKGSDGLYYKLNTDGMTVEKDQTDYNSINGQVIRAKSITATKIDVKDLVAFGATIGGFNISETAIYSGLKESVDNPFRGIYMDNDGQLAFGDSGQFVKFYKTSTGEYKLAIAAEDLHIGLTNVSDAIDDMDNMKDELVTSLVIESSNGVSFDPDDDVPAVLTVTVNYGRTRITDSEELTKIFGSEVYLEWSYKRSGEESWTTIQADDTRITDEGFTLSTTREDLLSQTTFKCRLIGNEHGTINPDQETVIDRLENRLKSYVDETLMPGVRDDFEAVKEEVIAEMNTDAYISRIETNEKNITALQKAVEDLQYIEIKILSFTCNITVAEIGSTVTELKFSWKLNKTPNKLRVADTELPVTTTSYVHNGAKYTSARGFSITASDERKSETMTIYLNFYNGVYFGTSELPDAIDSQFIMTLQRSLQSSKTRTFSVTSGEDMYIWYALPARYGIPTFKVGGFDGGFTKVSIIDFTNASGYTEKYDVYRSDNSNLGSKTINVT